MCPLPTKANGNTVCEKKKDVCFVCLYSHFYQYSEYSELSILISLTVKINAFSLYKTLQLHTGTFNETDHS